MYGNRTTILLCVFIYSWKNIFKMIGKTLNKMRKIFYVRSYIQQH